MICGTRDDYNLEIVNFPFLDGDVPRSPTYGENISQLIRLQVCSNVDDFNNRNLFLTVKLLKQGYRYNKIRKAFTNFYHRHSELIVKYNIGLKTLLQEGISEPIFYGDSERIDEKLIVDLSFNVLPIVCGSSVFVFVL